MSSRSSRKSKRTTYTWTTLIGGVPESACRPSACAKYDLLSDDCPSNPFDQNYSRRLEANRQAQARGPAGRPAREAPMTVQQLYNMDLADSYAYQRKLYIDSYTHLDIPREELRDHHVLICSVEVPYLRQTVRKLRPPQVETAVVADSDFDVQAPCTPPGSPQAGRPKMGAPVEREGSEGRYSFTLENAVDDSTNDTVNSSLYSF